MVVEKNKKTAKNKTKKLTKKQLEQRQFYWIIGTMIGLIALFFVFSYIFQGVNEFEYKGLSFTKEKFGELDVYHYYRYYESLSGDLIKQNVYLRNDPRENKVPKEGEIVLPSGKFIYISIDDRGLNGCEYGNVAIDSLTSFLVNADLKVRGALTNESVAEKQGLAYATCDTHPNNAVILLTEGNETKITRNGMCYVMEINECEVLDAVEKFEVEALIDARKRARLD